MKTWLIAPCLAAALAAGPLAAQTTPAPPGARPPSSAPEAPQTLPRPDDAGRPGPPMGTQERRGPLGPGSPDRGIGEPDRERSPGTTREPTGPRRPGADGVSGSAPGNVAPGNIDERMRAPSDLPRPRTGAPDSSRFSADLQACDGLDAEERSTCRRERFAARADGLYRQ